MRNLHDRTSGVFVPVFYALSTSRTGDSYWDMIQFIVQAMDQQIDPAEIVCDFEAALMDALQMQFPNAIALMDAPQMQFSNAIGCFI
ncbi:unnamed protein product [Phytophthora fragariaefolia]|uniref:Unnamed protein product n=1 Tax=Phytophthora fragariaefolia TaxID=1490495 RepID=A0A9W6Y5G1_9STRA|nr:unnamed protein product [Phytophthora fragariaefolia]